MPKRLLPALITLLLSACSTTPRLEGQALTDFYLTDQNEKVWSSQKLQNDTVLIDFWATWCVPCLKAIPDMNAFHKLHGDKVKLLGIAIEEGGWDKIKPAITRFNIQYPVAVGLPSLGKAYAVTGFPYLVVLKNGKIQKQLVGPHSLKDLELVLKDELK